MTSARKRTALLRELEALAPQLLRGSVSTTYRTCGKPGCACHRGQRHGPYLHVSYREGGRTRSYHVPAGRQEAVREGVAAWERFQEIARELAEQHRRELGLGDARRARRPRGG
ncbi:MAG: DUF6788 family protein [Solirubrobacterales bacterium]